MALRLFLIMTLVWAWVAFRLVRHLPGSTGLRIGVAVLVFMVAQYHQVAGRISGSLGAPELPQWLLVLVGCAYGTFLLAALLLLVRDLAGVLLYLASRTLGRAVLTGAGSAVVTALVAVALSIYGTAQGLRVPPVKKLTLTVPGLPSAFDGYRLVQLSDLHAHRLLPGSWQSRVVNRVNRLQPDLVVITGDLEDGTPEARAADVAPLARLRARDGVLAVPGNHEYYADYAAWMSTFRELGLTMLANAHVLIEHNGQQIAVAGLTDSQARTFGAPMPDVAAALANIPEGIPIILLQHKPGSAPQNAAAGATLQLSGHTHGGQIWGASLLTRWANNGFLAGLYRVDGMQLYVSRGTGLWNSLIIRISAPSEITEMVLHPG